LVSRYSDSYMDIYYEERESKPIFREGVELDRPAVSVLGVNRGSSERSQN
jgi:hypothetical protein